MESLKTKLYMCPYRLLLLQTLKPSDLVVGFVIEILQQEIDNRTRYSTVLEIIMYNCMLNSYLVLMFWYLNTI